MDLAYKHIPNFFIVGAPKSGTTSLHYWLAQHPQIFMVEPKDENYLVPPLKMTYKVMHARMFDQVIGNPSIIGEASCYYLFKHEVIEYIEKNFPNSKYLVLLRNPISLSQSLHNQQIVNGNEHIHDFEAAWKFNNFRKIGQRVKPWVKEAQYMDYGEVSKIGQQLSKVLSMVDAKRVKWVFLEDIQNDPNSVMIELLSFLGCQKIIPIDLIPQNQAKKIKSSMVSATIKVLGQIKKELKIEFGFGILNGLKSMNLKKGSNQTISDAFKKELLSYFNKDIKILESITHRDLSHWTQ